MPRKLTPTQSLVLSGLPTDGSFVKRGSLNYTSYLALLGRGLVTRRRVGVGFEWARVVKPEPPRPPSAK